MKDKTKFIIFSTLFVTIITLLYHLSQSLGNLLVFILKNTGEWGLKEFYVAILVTGLVSYMFHLTLNVITPFLEYIVELYKKIK